MYQLKATGNPDHDDLQLDMFGYEPEFEQYLADLDRRAEEAAHESHQTWDSDCPNCFGRYSGRVFCPDCGWMLQLREQA